MNRHSGFTLIELLIIVAIISVLFSLSFIGAFNTVPKSSLDNQTQMLIGHLKEQQINAMTGATEGETSTSNFGIYFTDGEYIFFKGNSYDPDDSHNFSISVDDINISTSLANSNIIFLASSGQVQDSTTTNTITLTQKNIQQSKTITFNKYGIIE